MIHNSLYNNINGSHNLALGYQAGVDIVNIDNTMGVIRSVSGGRVIVDFNHPLSSKSVHYDVEIIKIVEDKKAMLQGEIDKIQSKVDKQMKMVDDKKGELDFSAIVNFNK